MDNELDNKSEKSQGILDTVSISQQSAILRNFNPQSAILEYLSQLEPREKQVIMSRYGLDTKKTSEATFFSKHLKLPFHSAT